MRFRQRYPLGSYSKDAREAERARVVLGCSLRVRRVVRLVTIQLHPSPGDGNYACYSNVVFLQLCSLQLNSITNIIIQDL